MRNFSATEKGYFQSMCKQFVTQIWTLQTLFQNGMVPATTHAFLRIQQWPQIWKPALHQPYFSATLVTHWPRFWWLQFQIPQMQLSESKILSIWSDITWRNTKKQKYKIRDIHRYNYCQIRTRGTVERTFGIWKRRFPCLNHIRTKLNTSLIIIVATAVLHNITRLVILNTIIKINTCS